MLTTKCFKELCMISKSEKAKELLIIYYKQKINNLNKEIEILQNQSMLL